MIGEVPDDPDPSSFKRMLMDGSLHCKIHNENLKRRITQRLENLPNDMLPEGAFDEDYMNKLAQHLGVSRKQIETFHDNVTVFYQEKPS
jgi:hypothetical protein